MDTGLIAQAHHVPKRSSGAWALVPHLLQQTEPSGIHCCILSLKTLNRNKNAGIQRVVVEGEGFAAGEIAQVLPFIATSLQPCAILKQRGF